MRNIILLSSLMLMSTAAIAEHIDDFSQDTIGDYQVSTTLGQGEPSIIYTWDENRKMLRFQSLEDAQTAYGSCFIAQKWQFQGDGYIAVDIESCVEVPEQKSWRNVSLCLYDTATPNEFNSSFMVGNGYKIQIYNGGQIQVKKMIDGATSSFIGNRSWVPSTKPFTLKIKRLGHTYYFYMNNTPLAVDIWNDVDLKYWGLTGSHDKATSMDVTFDNMRMATTTDKKRQ